ncbi:helix-turn-helix domain-containing protein [Lentilactobacillus kefiri]|uniref:helix-turn-helix domain-containing protein n=1 Tax=Lentilactobacillus kefiri TaxID=33962 RepID=UPI0021C2E05C|nr:XRE family transcriptional regulator [Lentilactobacillus kefiri]MCP9370118.1 helix-turn-helix domain-containing protein [Lentilactobacillus kefiri]
MTFNNALGNYLKQIRTSKGLSLREVSDRSHGKISHNTIYQAERGKNSRGADYVPSASTIKTLAEIYDTDYWKLMDLAGYAPTPTNLKVVPNSNGATVTADVGWETSSEHIDVYGEITAGIPTFADEHIIGQTIIPDELIQNYGKDNLFALEVDGDSMSRVIAPGFIAVFAKDCEVENGDICAVLVDGENATLKRFKETSKAVILEPDSFNPVYKPIIFPKTGEQNFRILGKYVFATSLLK